MTTIKKQAHMGKHQEIGKGIDTLHSQIKAAKTVLEKKRQEYLRADAYHRQLKENLEDEQDKMRMTMYFAK